jgi:hypothetical protein
MTGNNPYARHDDDALVRQLRQAASQGCHRITHHLTDDIARRLHLYSLARVELRWALDHIRYLEQFVSDEIKNQKPAAPVYQPTSRNE